MSDDAHRNPEKVPRERHVLGRGGKAGGEKASAAVDATAAARQAVEYLTQAAKSGAQVTVHYTEEAGKKIAHAFQDAK